MKILSLTAVRNEAPYFLEWLAWQRVLGVTDVLVYSNDCDDGTDRLLDRLAAEGVLEHIRNPKIANKSLQWTAFNAGWQHPWRAQADWMLISDLDEFPMIHAGAHRFADLLAAIPEDTEAVALPWRLFGAAGADMIRADPLTQTLTRSAPGHIFHPIATTFFKSVFRPGAFDKPGVHRPKRQRGSAAKWVGGDGVALADSLAKPNGRLSLLGHHEGRSLIEMHHYSLRSAQGFLVKSERGLPNRSHKAIDLRYWVERNFNTIENRAALALADPLRREMDALKALPGVADLDAQGRDWHRKQFEKIVRDPEGYRLYVNILHARDSAVLTAEQSVRLLNLFQEVG